MEKIIIAFLAKHRAVVISFVIGVVVGSGVLWHNKSESDNLRKSAEQLNNSLAESQKRVSEISNQLRIAKIRTGQIETSINISISGANELATNLNSAISDINDITRILGEIQGGD